MSLVPAVSQQYVPGAIVDHSWGYEQTNHDFFVITRRAGDFVTLQPMASEQVQTNASAMTGRVRPTTVKAGEPALRRKVKRRDGREIGFQIGRGYGWASLWDGTPKCISWYG